METLTREHQCQCADETEEQKLARIGEIIEAYRNEPGNLIQILHLAQGVYGSLPPHVQRLVAERLDVPLSKIHSVLSFYSFFTTKPRGEYTVRVCLGTACYVRGGMEIMRRLTQTLGVEVGGTTADNKFTLEVTRCIGACGLAPACTVNGEVYRQVNPDRLNQLLAKCK